MPLSRRTLLIAALALAVPAGLRGTPASADPASVALMGYDAVSYFDKGEAQPGAGHIALRWRGLVWHFTTVENRAAFEANPRAYVPQFGGLCPIALARGEVIAGDPRNWTIREGKLYLSSSAEGLDQLRSNMSSVLADAAQEFRSLQRR
jgi:hypothetical protein